MSKNDIDTIRNKLDELSNIDEASCKEILNILSQSTNKLGFDKNGKLKVSLFDAKNYDVEAFKKQASNRVTINSYKHSLNARTALLAKGSKVVCIFVNDKCDKEVIEQLASIGVELIALRCAGFNNVDLEACKAHNIDVVRVPAYSPQAVAEHAVALMLMLNRHLHQAYLRNRSGQFILDGLVGFNMYQKTIGIIGTGKIGKAVIDILTGFGCNILAYDINPNASLESQANVRYVDMPELLANSSIVSLHAPLLKETYHCINAEAINTMQKGSMLINTSRGGLVDTKALIDGLKTQQIGAAGLDVYEEEAGIFFNDMSNKVLNDDVLARLMSFSNVLITSHQGFLTHEALANISQTTIQNIEEYLDGKRGSQLSNIVTH